MIVKKLSCEEKVPSLGSLIVLFHAASGIAAPNEAVGVFISPRDKPEARNHRVYSELMPQGDRAYIDAAITGSFKPPDFIHPFEGYYSLPGYLDQRVLTAFFISVDFWVTKHPHPSSEEGKEFLSFLYMFFLLIHPFVDRNGRVARALLDYYNHKLRINCDAPWNKEKPKF